MLVRPHIRHPPLPRLAFLLEDVHRAGFFATTAPKRESFSLHKVTDLRIAWSRAAKDATFATADNQVVQSACRNQTRKVQTGPGDGGTSGSDPGTEVTEHHKAHSSTLLQSRFR